MEHGKLHIPVNGVDVDFYPETCFDDVIDTGTDLTLTQTLASVNQSITAEATARANADAALDDKIALKVATSTYDAKMLRLDESISSLSTNKLDASTYNTKMASLDGSISGLESNKADKSTTYTKTEADELYDGKVNKSGDTLTGALAFQGTNTVIKQTSDSGVVVIEGGTEHDLGARLSLAGKDFGNNNGTFWLTAHNGTDGYNLRGKVDGTLTWGDKNIDLVNDSGTGYIRYENGLQICWGVIDVTVNLTTSWGSIYETSSLTGTTYNYAKPFVSTPYITMGPSYENTVCIESINADANGLRLKYLYTFKSMSNYRFKGAYIAIGKWK